MVRLSAEELRTRAAALRERASPCVLCPRRCGVDRARGELGACRIGLRPWVASVGPHYGEEPVLVGRRGSGTVFLGGCNLACVFCQNADISQGGAGGELPVAALAGAMLGLQNFGCHNINLVSPTHQAPQLVEALALAREDGLSVPLVWNCGGYERVETLRLLEGVVDIYMPDVKYGDNAAGARYSSIPDYWDRARGALLEMHRQVGDLVTEGELAVRGVLVRHLVLPRDLAASDAVLSFLAEELGGETFVNIMAQYYPAHQAFAYPELSRRPTSEELCRVHARARELGLRRAGPH